MKAQRGLVRATLFSFSFSTSLLFSSFTLGRYPRIYDVRKTARVVDESRDGGAERSRRKAAASESNGGEIEKRRGIRVALRKAEGKRKIRTLAAAGVALR